MLGSFEVFLDRAALPDGLLAAVLVTGDAALVVVCPSIPIEEVEVLVGRLGAMVGIDLAGRLYR